MKRIVIAALVAVLVAVPFVASASVSAVGWWTRNPAASAPDGGGQVANGPDGVISYAAVRTVGDPDSIDTAMLALKEANGSVNGSGAAIDACPAVGSWKAGKGGLLDGPKADCSLGRVSLFRDAGGGWSADVASVLQGSSPSVALVPAEGASVFQVSFGPPELTVTTKATTGSSGGFSSGSESGSSGFTSGSGSGDSGSSGSSGGSSESDFSGTSGSSGGFSSPSGGGFSSGFDAGGTFAPVDTAPAPTEPAPEEAATDGVTAGPELAGSAAAGPVRAFTASSTEDTGNKTLQFLFFALLAALIGTGAGVARNQLAKRTASSANPI